MRVPAIAAILSAWLICGSLPLSAHHAFDSEFDMNKPVKLEGKLAEITWGNPHVYLEMDVPNNSGGTVNWHVELTSVSDLSRSGLNRRTLPIGSAISVEGFAARSGERLIGTTQMTIAATGQIVTTPPASWHHSFAETYDATKRIELTGTVTSVDGASQSARLEFAVSLPNGQKDEWQVETGRGWKKDDVSIGDVIQVSGSTTKDGSLKILARTVTLIATNGNSLSAPKKLLSDL